MEHVHNVLLDEGGGGGSEGDDGHPWELLLKTSQLQEVRSVLMMIFAVLTIEFLTEDQVLSYQNLCHVDNT